MVEDLGKPQEKDPQVPEQRSEKPAPLAPVLKKLDSWPAWGIYAVAIVVIIGSTSWGYYQYRGSITQVGNAYIPEEENDIPQQEQTDTSNWRTYRNEEYGFELRYPLEYVLKFNQETKVLILAENPGDYEFSGMWISIYENESARPLDWWSKHKEAGFGDPEALNVANQEAISVEPLQETFSNKKIVLSDGDDLFLVSQGLGTDGDLILSSFKFIEPSGNDSGSFLDGIPQLYPGVTWTEVAISKDLSDGGIYYFNNRTKDSGYVYVNGKAWSSKKTDLTEAQLKSQDFGLYYDENFKQPDWKFSLVLEDLTFQAAAADSPDGSVWAYLGGEGDRIRYIVLSYHHVFHTELSESEETPLQFGCPCDETLRVFVSEVVDIRDIIPN